MSSLSISYAVSPSEESDRTGTLVDSDTYLPSANLESGSDYLILANASMGADAGASPVAARISAGVVEYGATEWASIYTRAVNRAGSTPVSMDGNHIATAFVLSGDGSSDLKIRYRQGATGDPGYPAYISGKALVAIPLGDLTEGSDYWYDQSDTPSDTAEVTFTTGDNSVRSASFSLSETGNYIVFASYEYNQVDAGNVMRGWLEIDGSQFRDRFQKQRYVSTDWFQASWVGTVYLESGSHSFDLIGSATTGTGNRNVRRSRIVLIRCNRFATIVNNLNLSDSLISDAYPSYNNMLSRTYPFSVGEDVIILSGCVHRDASSGGETGIRIYDATGAATLGGIVSCEGYAFADEQTLVAIAADTVSADNEYTTQAVKRFSSPYQKKTEIIIWGMTLSEKYATADSSEDLSPGEDVSAGWNATGSPHYEEINDAIGSSGAMTDYIQAGSAGLTDEYRVGGIPSRLRLTQKVQIAFTWQGLNTGVQPGTEFYLETGPGDSLTSDSFDMGTLDNTRSGHTDEYVLMITRTELEALILRLISSDGSSSGGPDPET